MKVSALDCLRNGGEIRGNLNVHAKAQINGKRSIEYQLARKNVASNRKQMKSAVMALSVSMILFVSMSGLKEIADGVQEYIRLTTDILWWLTILQIVSIPPIRKPVGGRNMHR